MQDFILSCCSTADLTKEHFEKRNINYICMHYYLDDVHYLDDLGESMSFEDFYRSMKDGVDTRTSQINAAEFEEYFEGFLKQGKDVLHVSLSSASASAMAFSISRARSFFSFSRRCSSRLFFFSFSAAVRVMRGSSPSGSSSRLTRAK